MDATERCESAGSTDEFCSAAHPLKDLEDFESSGMRRMPKPIEFVKDPPTNPWQIVLIPDEKNSMVRIEGYGNDLEAPLISKRVKIPAW